MACRWLERGINAALLLACNRRAKRLDKRRARDTGPESRAACKVHNGTSKRTRTLDPTKVVDLVTSESAGPLVFPPSFVQATVSAS